MRRPWEAEHDLLHPVNGYAAEYIRGKQGTSIGYGLRAAEEEILDLRRMLVLLRGFRGIRLEDHAHEIIPGADGWLEFSTDEFLQWEQADSVHHGHLSLDLEALAEALPGCSFQICTNEGATLTIECGDLLRDVGETGVPYVRVVGDGLPGGVTDRVGWRVEVTPEEGDEISQTHIGRMRGSDGFTYKLNLERDLAAGPPTYPECGE